MSALPRQADEEAGLVSAGEWVSREGMVTVYNHDGEYVGCMGVERWERLLCDDAEEHMGDMVVLGSCPHGVDLDREFCPQGCRV